MVFELAERRKITIVNALSSLTLFSLVMFFYRSVRAVFFARILAITQCHKRFFATDIKSKWTTGTITGVVFALFIFIFLLPLDRYLFTKLTENPISRPIIPFNARLLFISNTRHNLVLRGGLQRVYVFILSLNCVCLVFAGKPEGEGNVRRVF
ncbi:hypothetical protein N4G41_10125 [Kosakonia sacchari]|uniref:hypothetical protein n=1 Tax=Kosakonia sacchari TaxID=1158459 RepID=UPI002ACE93BB|nr:hypothetical protein [Kosakonia sacchari]MDZ7321990.1 hypothetical protein [Kosakonia sacchari]